MSGRGLFNASTLTPSPRHSILPVVSIQRRDADIHPSPDAQYRLYFSYYYYICCYWIDNTIYK